VNRAIIFDVDGTLSETEETHRKAFNRAFSATGLAWYWDQDLYRQLLAVTGGKERIRYFIDNFSAEGAPTARLDEFIRDLHADKTVAYAGMVRNGEVELRPGVRETVAAAKRAGYRLAIATTTTPVNVDALLAATFGDDGRFLFDVICAGDSAPRKKPAPDVYLRALEELDLSARQCVAIEDSRNGLLAALAAGVVTIVTPGIYTLGEDFNEAALVADSLERVDFAVIEALFP